MKVSIAYPPFKNQKGVALLSQNRQFQWFSNPTYIYPIIPAYAATLLKEKGHKVLWNDGIAQKLTYDEWLDQLLFEKPDLIIFESKTPVIKQHWDIIDELKKLNDQWRIVLVGDHVTALPEESLSCSSVDFIITGGDYDFSILQFCGYLSQNEPPPKGLYYRENGKILNTGKPDLNSDLNTLPFIDRDLTHWKDYAYKNGNYKYTPGTYTMAGRDCWWGKCSFCSWTTLYPGKTFRTVSVKRHLDEIGSLIENYHIKEIFDDSGCFPNGKWLETFCKGIIDRGYHRKAVFGCNMRVGALTKDQWILMKKANFRFVLIGLESMNQNTLNRLNKGIKVEEIAKTIKDCKQAGLSPHITTMVGYPWEEKKDAEKTIQFAKYLFKQGYLDTLQATIVVPYPGTPLFDESKENGWLLTEDWEKYDMKQSVWKSPVSNDDIKRYTQELYKTALGPAFILNKLKTVRNFDDIRFLFKAGRKLIAHLIDFKN